MMIRALLLLSMIAVGVRPALACSFREIGVARREGANLLFVASRGKLDLHLLVMLLPTDATLRDLARLDSERSSRRLEAGERAETPARFTQGPDGSVHLEQVTSFEDGRTLTIRGERISAASIVCSW